MAKPNYSYEKRQRELAKKQKKDRKEREKADRKTHPGGGEDAGTTGNEGASDDAAPAQDSIAGAGSGTAAS